MKFFFTKYIKKIIISLLLMFSIMNCNLFRRPEWIRGQLGVTLYDHVVDELFDEFVLEYKKYDFKLVELISPSRIQGHYYFDPEIIKSSEFRDLLKTDNRVILAHVVEPGVIYISLHGNVYGRLFDNFINDYKQYNFSLKEIFKLFDRLYLFTFNYRKINEHVFLEMIRRDERVIEANFNYIIWNDLKPL